VSETTADNAPTVRDNTEAHRFEIVVDGAVAGFADYHDRGMRRSFTHTEIDPAYEGRGLGSTLVRAVLDDARAAGLAVLPHCQFVRSYIDENRSDYLDLVPEADRATFELG
jgi:predicted GNAT family acetyltransferase